MRRDDLQVVHTITIRNHLGEIEDVERLSCERRSFLGARRRKEIVETPCRYANACALLIILRYGCSWHTYLAGSCSKHSSRGVLKKFPALHSRRLCSIYILYVERHGGSM